MRILAQNPLLTMAELATKLAKSSQWLGERLNLVKLPDAIGTLVDEGKINLSNAYALAKLAAVEPEEVQNWLERSMTEPPSMFVVGCQARVKEIKDARRQGREATPTEFIPIAHLRKISELKTEMETSTIAPALIKHTGVKSEVEAFQLGIRWALHMDPVSIEEAKRKDAERKIQLEAEKAKRKQEKEEQKKAEAAKATAGALAS